jgi:NADH dehydrogenase
VVVLGGGFAGLEAMRVLDRRLGRRGDVELLLVSDRNYLLFTPLLPQVASSLVEPRHIIQPIRDVRGSGRFRFLRDEVVDVDLDRRRVITRERMVPYDRLVIALGGVTPTFGTPGVEEHALPYKRLEDGSVLRDHLLDLAEHADHEPDPAQRRRMLTVCVVGGGYTGVELITELQDLFHSYIVPKYRGIEARDYSLLLVEAGDEILRGVHPALAARASARLRREGIEVRTRTRATRVLDGAIELNAGVQVPVGLTVWAAGVKGSPALAALPVARDRLGRLVVEPTMRLPSHPEVYGAGDAVTVDGHPRASIPIIPAALAHGRLAADNIVADLEGRPPDRIDFAPRGMLVSLGERDAVVEVFRLRFSGYLAWFFWNAVHLYKLVGLRKQIQVALDWSLTRVFPRDSAIMRPTTMHCTTCRAGAHGRTGSGGSRSTSRSDPSRLPRAATGS